MLSTEVDSPEGSSQIETGSTESICIHCGLTVPETRKSSARQKSFCCNGCEVAYAILHEDDELIESWQARPASEWELDFHEFDHPSFQEVHSRELAENLRETQLQLSGIYCFSCLFAIEKLPRFLSGVREARVNMASSRVTLIWDPELISLSSIAHTLHRMGYRPFPLNDQQQEIQERNENRQELIRLAVAGACAGNAMLLALALYHGLFLGMASEFRVMFELLGMGIALISLVWPGRVFFLNA
ncbi:MAG: heavy metal translocating P-type ATPase metal-binding domain-containing protein, partial [Planctomycetaceae bacterium]|nr:heavy metal translocating P-type ATPase metal-binding domain-containing protein [Planctomycetaceae bacterium]